MRSWSGLGAALLWAGLGGACAVGQERAAPATGEVLGAEGRRERAWIALRDVHPLWGGRDVWVEGSGRVVVREVAQGGAAEQRATGQVPAAEAQALLARAVELDLLRVKVPERPGVPDEARPALVLHGAGGAEGAVSKWERDPVPALDELRAALTALADRLLQATPPADAGRYDPAWRPFPALVLTVDCMSGRPNPRCDLSDPEELEALRQRLRELPALDAAPEPGQLGMRGYLLEPRGVEGFPAHVRVHDGRVWLVDPAGSALRVARDAHGLEAWLRERAGALGMVPE